MKDMAYKVIALYKLHSDAIERDDEFDTVFDLQFDLQEAAVDLAEAVALFDPYEGIKLCEVAAYAEVQQMCFQHALAEIVEAGIKSIKNQEV